MTHLYFDIIGAFKSGEEKHPEEVMKSLGISYQHATPQSMFDAWQFWNCENLPSSLPSFLEERNWNPMEYVGHGLTHEDAKKISDYFK